MDSNVLIGLTSVVLLGLTFFGGQQFGRAQERRNHRHAENLQQRDHDLQRKLELERQRDASVARVVDKFVELVSSATTNGIYGLADAGIAALQSDADAREAISRIVLHTGQNPLGGEAPTLESIDLMKFFRFVRERGLRFDQIGVTSIIERMRASGIDPERPIREFPRKRADE